mgnify:FL=1
MYRYARTPATTLAPHLLTAGLLAGHLAVSGTAAATCGMALAGYGARAGAMGGAGMGYDAGNSNVMNNPAAFGLRDEKNVFGAGLSVLGPDVEAEAASGATVESDGDFYPSPSLSLIRTNAAGVTYGAAFLAQGGMGTEYGDDSFLSPSGKEVRSEVSFGRLMLPLAYRVNDRLSVAAQVDYVLGNMDLQMDMKGSQVRNLMNGVGGSFSASPALMGALPSTLEYARVDFSNGSDLTGEAQGSGLAGKIGALLRVTPRLTVGAAYHSESHLGDLTTSSNGAELAFKGTSNPPVALQGEVAVEDFEWPATYGIGAAYEVSDRLMVAADVKQIAWSEVLEDFSLTFTASDDAANDKASGDFRGEKADLTLDQEWDDQTVYSLGGAFKATPALTLRAGVSIANNPVPADYINPLFPAIIEDHVTGGLSYALTERSKVGAAALYAPEVEVTNPRTGVTSRHSQISGRLNYVYRF